MTSAGDQIVLRRQNSCSFTPVLFFPAMHPPPIPIEAFQYCFFNQGQAQEVTLVSFSLAYGKSKKSPIPPTCFQSAVSDLSSSRCFVKPTKRQRSFTIDLLAFAIVVWESRRRGSLGRSDIPTILDNIVKDATVYFLVIFGSHLVAECCILFAPVSR